MSNMNVTWPDAVPVEQILGQQNSFANGLEVEFDVGAMVGAKFDVRPSFSYTQVSVYDGAVPYISVEDEDFWAENYAEVSDDLIVEPEAMVKKRVKKAV